MQVPLEPAKAKMNRSKQLSPEERRGNFVEISLGFSGEQARIEAERCLRCDVRERVRMPVGADGRRSPKKEAVPSGRSS
jgi:hypothetical protein